MASFVRCRNMWFRILFFVTMVAMTSTMTKQGHRLVAADREQEIDDEEHTCKFDPVDGDDGNCGIEIDPNFQGYVKVEWGEDQHVAGEERLATQRILQKTHKYMHEEVFVDDVKYKAVREECKLRNELCSFWAAIGECDANPAFNKGVWSESGQLNAMFTRITTEKEFTEKYEIQVLSRDPWIVQLDNFTTEEECQNLIALGAELGYERSEDVGGTEFDGTTKGIQSKDRTSTNAWCTDQCEEHVLSRKTTARIESLTGVKQNHFEFLQLLRYEKGQHYAEHHDYIEIDRERPPGVRLVTVFLYLNEPTAGGGTNFPNIGKSGSRPTPETNITVMPKVGRALIWPSVLDRDPDRKDPRTNHQALPVIEGIKYGANAWIHARDFKGAHAKGCV